MTGRRSFLAWTLLVCGVAGLVCSATLFPDRIVPDSATERASLLRLDPKPDQRWEIWLEGQGDIRAARITAFDAADSRQVLTFERTAPVEGATLIGWLELPADRSYNVLVEADRVPGGSTKVPLSVHAALDPESDKQNAMNRLMLALGSVLCLLVAAVLAAAAFVRRSAAAREQK